MKKYYKKTSVGIVAINYTDEQIDELKAAGANLELLDEHSDEVQAHLKALKQREAAAALEQAAFVPHAVTMRQARLVLLQAGLLTKIDKTIAGMPSPQREAATIEWEYSSEVKRGGALVQQLGKALGLDDAALDAMFKAAAAL